MAELILLIKLCICFIFFLVACGIVLLLVLVIYAIKYFRGERKKKDE